MTRLKAVWPHAHALEAGQTDERLGHRHAIAGSGWTAETAFHFHEVPRRFHAGGEATTGPPVVPCPFCSGPMTATTTDLQLVGGRTMTGVPAFAHGPPLCQGWLAGGKAVLS